MSFLCKKSINLGITRYNPGDTIPDDAVLNSRKRALIANGYIAEMNGEQKAVEAQQYTAELKETDLGAYDGVVTISIGTAGEGENAQTMALPMKPEEIQQTFAIMQLNAEEGAKEIANVVSENVLILLHAVDSRNTIKKAAEKQADNLFPSKDVTYESGKDNETEGADT